MVVSSLIRWPVTLQRSVQSRTLISVKPWNELAQLDGGFILSSTGTVVSACRYFEAALPKGDQPLGLGTRHIAAASVSLVTGAIRGGGIGELCGRLYAEGALINEILTEVWLLHR